MIKYYIKLTLYNYDLQSRYDEQKIRFDDFEKAKRAYIDLENCYGQLTYSESYRKTAEWLLPYGWDNAHVHTIDGLYKETIEKIVI